MSVTDRYFKACNNLVNISSSNNTVALTKYYLLKMQSWLNSHQIQGFIVLPISTFLSVTFSGHPDIFKVTGLKFGLQKTDFVQTI